MTQMKGMVECWVDWKWEIPFVFFVLFVAKNSSVQGQILATETKEGRFGNLKFEIGRVERYALHVERWTFYKMMDIRR